MTTVAFDGNKIAADTMAVDFGNRVQYPVYKLRHQGRYIFAGSGAMPTFEAFIEWFEAGCPKEMPHVPEDTSYHGHLLVFDLEGGENFCFAPWPKQFYPHTFSAPYAVGSGMDFALAAMACGKDAEEAVKIASLFDPNTGGPVQVIDLQDLIQKELAA
jgi:hypothetical protein